MYLIFHTFWGVVFFSINYKAGKQWKATLQEQLKVIAEAILVMEIKYRNKDASYEEKT